MAANTSYARLPMRLSLIASNGYAPRQFCMRGIRLGFSNGIMALSAIMTITTVFSIAYSKMLEGAWIAILLMAVLMLLMKITNLHYKDIARQLRLEPEEVATESSLIQIQKHVSSPGDMITVVVSQFGVSKSWQNLLHNQTAFAIRKKLLRDRHIAVITIPYVLDKI